MRKFLVAFSAALALVACDARKINGPCLDPVVSISLSADTIFVGQSKGLAAAWQPNDATVNSVTWTSSAVAVATVSSSGVITGITPGETNVTVKVTCCSGTVSKEATAKIVVRERAKLPTTIVVAPDTVRMYVGDKTRASAVVSGEPGISLSVLWASETPTIATVSNTGEITGVSPGTTGVRARAAADSTKSGRVVVIVAKLPDPVPSPTITLSADPSQIVFGGISKIDWTSTGTNACMRSATPAINGWSGASAVSGSQTLSGLAIGSYTLTQACAGPGGTATASVTLVVTSAPPPPSASPTVTLAANPPQFVVGGTTSVPWSSTNALSCVRTSSPAVSAWNGTPATSGSITLSGLAIGTYEISILCTGPGGTASKSILVIVGATPPPPPSASPTVTLAANPPQFVVGGTTSVPWSSTNALSCVRASSPAVSAWNGTPATSGSITLSGLAIGTYEISILCTGPGGTASKSILVIVGATPPPPPSESKMEVRFAASRGTVFVNQGLFVSGEAFGAKSCSASSSPKTPLWAGSKPINLFSMEIGFPEPGLYRISYTCVSLNGLHTSTNSIDVLVLARETPPPQEGFVRSISITPKTDTLKKEESAIFKVSVEADEGVTRAFECESTNPGYGKATKVEDGCKVEILAESSTLDVRFQVIARTIGLARASNGRLLPLEASALITVLKKQ